MGWPVSKNAGAWESPGVAACCVGLKVRVKSQEKVEGVREPVRRVGPRAVGRGAWGPTGPLGLE